MKTREKQNKHKLKFTYIARLQTLGRIWKEHCALVSPDVSKTDKNYISEVVRLMSRSKREEFCSALDVCDDILDSIGSRVDVSLRKSHRKFSIYKKIILNS